VALLEFAGAAAGAASAASGRQSRDEQGDHAQGREDALAKDPPRSSGFSGSRVPRVKARGAPDGVACASAVRLGVSGRSDGP
jgi:hypothetical protein